MWGPPRRPCFSRREGRGCPGAQSLFTLASSCENLSVLKVLIKWPDGASLRQGEGPCASVVSRGVEQSGLREGGPVYISISAAVFKGLRRRRCGWMTAWSSRLLVRLYLGYR